QATNVVMNETPESSPEGLDQLTAMVSSGALKIEIAAEKPLAQAPRVLDEVKAGTLHGKIELRVAR
ncbi:MAG: hypothetical protein ACLQPV_07090, partial [Vulcanimicrobiaceae bacterium]